MKKLENRYYVYVVGKRTSGFFFWTFWKKLKAKKLKDLTKLKGFFQKVSANLRNSAHNSRNATQNSRNFAGNSRKSPQNSRYRSFWAQPGTEKSHKKKPVLLLITNFSSQKCTKGQALFTETPTNFLKSTKWKLQSTPFGSISRPMTCHFIYNYQP